MYLVTGILMKYCEVRVLLDIMESRCSVPVLNTGNFPGVVQ